MTEQQESGGEEAATPHRRKRRKMLPSGFATLRDVCAFVIGIGVILWEVAGSAKVDPYVLAAGLAMAGLPVVFGADERRKE